MSPTSCRLAYSWPSDSFDTFAALSARSKRYAASGADGKTNKAGVVCQTRKPASPGGIFEGYLTSATAAFSPPGALLSSGTYSTHTVASTRERAALKAAAHKQTHTRPRAMLTGVTRCPTSFSDVCDLGRTVRATYIHETHRPPIELRNLSSQTISLPAPTPTCTLACMSCVG